MSSLTTPRDLLAKPSSTLSSSDTTKPRHEFSRQADADLGNRLSNARCLSSTQALPPPPPRSFSATSDGGVCLSSFRIVPSIASEIFGISRQPFPGPVFCECAPSRPKIGIGRGFGHHEQGDIISLIWRSVMIWRTYYSFMVTHPDYTRHVVGNLLLKCTPIRATIKSSSHNNLLYTSAAEPLIEKLVSTEEKKVIVFISSPAEQEFLNCILICISINSIAPIARLEHSEKVKIIDTFNTSLSTCDSRARMEQAQNGTKCLILTVNYNAGLNSQD